MDRTEGSAVYANSLAHRPWLAVFQTFQQREPASEPVAGWRDGVFRGTGFFLVPDRFRGT